jgi:hypothetical protein
MKKCQCLGSREKWGKVLALIPDDDLRQDIESSMDNFKTGVER